MLNTLKASVNVRAAGLATADQDVGALTALAMNGMLPMWNNERQLFCYSLRQSESGLVQQGLSRRYTMMTLIGLQRCQQHGMLSPLNLEQILNGMLGDAGWIDNIGDLGLLLWTCAAVSPERVNEVASCLNVESALNRFNASGRGRTMELAWYLSGLSHACLSRPELITRLRKSAVRTSQLLKQNQGADGFFGHSARRGSLAAILRGHIGSFADQVYPIYAHAKFGQAFDVWPAVEMARNCAEAICQAQGAAGQWWWHYNSKQGRVFERYPVYSVHQHGMGPMALFAAGEAAGKNFNTAIYKGLRWIGGDNELLRDFREPKAGIVWRSVYPASRYHRYLCTTRSVLGFKCETEPTGKLTVKWECRPYELGWLLYAFAGRRSANVS